MPQKAATEEVRRVADYEIIEPGGGSRSGSGSHVRRHSSQELTVSHQTGWKFANQGEFSALLYHAFRRHFIGGEG